MTKHVHAFARGEAEGRADMRKILGGNAIELYDLDVAEQNWNEQEAAAADDD